MLSVTKMQGVLPLGGTIRYASINNHNGRRRYPIAILSVCLLNRGKNSPEGTT